MKDVIKTILYLVAMAFGALIGMLLGVKVYCSDEQWVSKDGKILGSVDWSNSDAIIAALNDGIKIQATCYPFGIKMSGGPGLAGNITTFYILASMAIGFVVLWKIMKQFSKN